MNIRKTLKFAGVVFLIVLFLGLLFSTVGPSTSFRLRRSGQRWMSEQNLKDITSGLIAYALDHGEDFPTSLDTLSDQAFERYGFAYRAFAHGNHVRPYVPSKNGNPAPRHVTRVFGHYGYLATKDRCLLIVFERPGLWDDQTLAYLAIDLKGRWKWDSSRPIDLGVRPTRVTEAQFADYVAKLDAPADELAPADRLVAAVKDGELKEIAGLADKAGSVDTLDRRGWSALTMAAQCGRADVVEFLISKGANINARDNAGLGRTALMRAAIAGDEKTVGTLLLHHADVHITLDDGSTALMAALPHPSIVERLLATGADSRERIRADWSALIAASANGNTESARLLIEHGADLPKDASDALMWAAENNHPKVIPILLAHGAGARAEDLREAVDWAPSNPDLLRALIASGGDLNRWAPCCSNQTVLMNSALEGQRESVDLLIAGGANLNATDNHGYTAIDLVKAVLSAKGNTQTEAERKALMDIIEALQKAGAKESGLKFVRPMP